MSRQDNLSEDVLRAFVSLPTRDREKIKLDLAEEVVKAALAKLGRVRDRGLVIRYALSGRHIGNQGTREKRQKTFAAYWRLTRKVLDSRYPRPRPTVRRKRETA